MNGRRIVQNFTSYVGLDAKSGAKEKFPSVEEVKPRLLSGELVIGAAHNVVLFSPVSEKRSGGKIGSLYVTNYKLSFVTDDRAPGGCAQRNLLLGPYDVTLSAVGSVYELSGVDADDSASKWRRRQLRPNRAVPQKIAGLQIHCKNFRVLSFGFEFSSGRGRAIATSLLHHAFPKRHDLLFAYECEEPYRPATTPSANDPNPFRTFGDWRREMDRTGVDAAWRTSRANAAPDVFCRGAGETLVVPASVLDCQLADAARHFRGGRAPAWVWSAPGGAALARCGELERAGDTDASAADHLPESVLLEAVRRAHPARTAPRVMSLRAPALRAAHERLARLCTPNALNDFWEQDGHFYSSLESTRWLRYVSESLALASQAADLLSKNITVVLQEGDGMDYCAVVSSLAQLLLDSHCRTVKGFQSLIQKEWIALGHPFSDRLGHVALEESDKSDGDREKSPVFLLFLDCCWQLQRQFPSSFEFSESYLTTLWDSAHNQLFDTFLFNNPREREIALKKCPNLRSVWDWKEQFEDDEIKYFYNPLYSPPAKPTHCPKSLLPPSAIRLPGLASPQRAPEKVWLEPSPASLVPKTTVPSLDVWQQCYFRWLPLLHIQGSGNIQFLLYNMRLAREIVSLQAKLSEADSHRRSNGSNRRDEDEANAACPHPSAVGAFFPFVDGASCSSSLLASDPLALLTTSLLEPNQQLDSQSILNAPD